MLRRGGGGGTWLAVLVLVMIMMRMVVVVGCVEDGCGSVGYGAGYCSWLW